MIEGENRAGEQGSKTSIDQWFYQRRWHVDRATGPAPLDPTCWMVFQDPTGLGSEIALNCERGDMRSSKSLPGGQFKRKSAVAIYDSSRSPRRLRRSCSPT